MWNSAVKSTPLWRQIDLPEYSSLQGNVQCDVCIIGAGIAGLTTAYLLRRAGLKVFVVEDDQIGSGETGRTTAHLSNALDDRYFKLEKLHGAVGAQLAAQSHTAAIDLIEFIIREEKIECGFERVEGYLFLTENDTIETLERELAAAHRAGLTEVEKVDQSPLQTFETGPALRFPRQAQFHPLQYLAGLATAFTRRNGKIYTRTRAREIKGGKSAQVIVTSGHVITTKAIVVATNTPINDIVTIHTKQAAYQTYVIAASVPRGSIPAALYWDTGDPYHYVRLQSGSLDTDEGEAFDLLIVGGEDHKTGQDDDPKARYAKLEAWTRERFPMVFNIEYRWSGEIMEPVDGLAFIGPNPGDEPNVYLATGDSGNGMTHGTIAGMLLADLIQQHDNEWAQLYDPARLTPRALGEYARENLNAAARLAEWLTKGDVSSPEEIPLGSGAVMRQGLSKVAVYRDTNGKVHKHSAVCPHLDCIVHWNNAEKTWDCPCHGSRFDPYGQVLHGPANKNLGVIKESHQPYGEEIALEQGHDASFHVRHRH
jgi:glycine/D-amino acid oxidase-like deaminating enzyme/nitrite reductase/ring-hydroxylating ferredoxin subunit